MHFRFGGHTHASDWFDLVPEMNQKLLASRINGKPIDFGALSCGYTPVDLDTFAMDNSTTKIELAVRTYAGVDASTQWTIHRPGKRERIWQDKLDLAQVGSEANPVHRIYRLTERPIDKRGVVCFCPNTCSKAGRRRCQSGSARLTSLRCIATVSPVTFGAV